MMLILIWAKMNRESNNAGILISELNNVGKRENEIK